MPKLKTGRRHHHSAIKKYYDCSHRYRFRPLQDISNRQGHHSPVQDSSNGSNDNNVNVTPLEVLALARIPQWHIATTTDNLELSFLEGASPNVVKFSVTINKILTWNVRVRGKLLPVDSQVYEELPVLATSVETLKQICDTIQQMDECEGNNDTFFVVNIVIAI
jgi:hypothetical protein